MSSTYDFPGSSGDERSEVRSGDAIRKALEASDDIIREVANTYNMETAEGRRISLALSKIISANAAALGVSVFDPGKPAVAQAQPKPEDLWECSGCGTRKSMEQIKAEHPTALSCCPERKMGPAIPSAHREASK